MGWGIDRLAAMTAGRADSRDERFATNLAHEGSYPIFSLQEPTNSVKLTTE